MCKHIISDKIRSENRGLAWVFFDILNFSFFRYPFGFISDKTHKPKSIKQIPLGIHVGFDSDLFLLRRIQFGFLDSVYLSTLLKFFKISLKHRLMFKSEFLRNWLLTEHSGLLPSLKEKHKLVIDNWNKNLS